MSSKWRRFEVLLPLQFNDGRDVPAAWLAEAVLEIVDHFGAASYETQKLEGHWRQGGVVYRDDLVRLVVDVPDTAQSREWMKEFKGRWKTRLQQLELWMVSYTIEVGIGRRTAAFSRFGRERMDTSHSCAMRQPAPGGYIARCTRRMRHPRQPPSSKR
ncbi:MAG TPA: hypothetical protein VMT20_04535 [Terriglobia bacterium]|nr:hypothetical protein [Terriglobia bacterium]